MLANIIETGRRLRLGARLPGPAWFLANTRDCLPSSVFALSSFGSGEGACNETVGGPGAFA